ncbi:MAG TPA: lysophospholipid acyltransferase family protein [Dongiaceae bacterium]|nr:lysophospholipid acyltransferase family protein [Dongiaceae bacterium]
MLAKRSDTEIKADQGGAIQGDVISGDAIKRKRRKPAEEPAWELTDFKTMASLALLLLPAWLLPERSWAPLCRARIALSTLTGARAIKRTAKTVRKALGQSDVANSEAIIRGLKAAVYEMRMQDLRGWRPDGWKPHIVLEGEEHLRAALGGGKGAILWLAPFVFNSGPTKIILHQKGYRVSHLSSPKHGVSETRFGVRYLNRIRCIPEDRYLADRIVFDSAAPTTAMRRMVRALKAGEVVSIVASSTEGYEMIKGPIFGGRLSVAVGAPRLAALTGAPLLPVFTVRDPDAGWRIVVEQPIAIASDRSSDERCLAAVAEFLRRSEPWVRRFPEQWRAWSKWREE